MKFGMLGIATNTLTWVVLGNDITGGLKGTADKKLWGTKYFLHSFGKQSHRTWKGNNSLERATTQKWKATTSLKRNKSAHYYIQNLFPDKRASESHLPASRCQQTPASMSCRVNGLLISSPRIPGKSCLVNKQKEPNRKGRNWGVSN